MYYPLLCLKNEFEDIKIVLQYLTFSYIQTTFSERGQKAFKKGFYKKITINCKRGQLIMFCFPSKVTLTRYRSNFQRVEKLTGHFVHMEPFYIFALFTQNCRAVIFPSKLSNNMTRKSMFAISCCNKATSAPVIYTLCNMEYCVFSLIVSSSNQQLLVVTFSYQQLLVVASSYQYQLLVVTISYWLCQWLLLVASSYLQLLIVTSS